MMGQATPVRVAVRLVAGCDRSLTTAINVRLVAAGFRETEKAAGEPAAFPL